MFGCNIILLLKVTTYVFICSNESSGIDSIYDKDIIDMTLEVLNLKDGLLLREQNELTMIQDVFSDRIYDTKYYKKFKKFSV